MWSPCPGVPAKPGGACAYCSQGIRYCFWVQSADGRKFYVGSECISRTGDKNLAKAVDAEKAKFAREQRLQKANSIREATRELLDADPTALTQQPHPSIPGKTLRDYVKWLLLYGGTASTAKIAKLIKQVGDKS